ncbi:alpha-L-rhamnosidase [Microdochium trichocladiopsis]|uniref:Alpha-L-rhamnosidase n=1 Tax=Microdochium trichocladiopsis TaxID=1682393 RepID=A0A9P8YAQ6_9PEZI|nr:alpha-L-rhamnosidase [Microdochium trichocladiopsis]KAH7033706.1 alpha-L-rhamnosidase [Microdochium trichocladiopsis]
MLLLLHGAAKPQRIVTFESSDTAFFGVRAVASTKYNLCDLPNLAWGKEDDFVLDFGIHMVGTLSFTLSSVGEHMDSPCRLRLIFGESPLDVTMGMEGVKTWISTAWLPDEIINIDICPERVELQRRHAFRYLRIQVIDTSSKFKVAFSDVVCECISAISQEVEVDAISFGDAGNDSNKDDELLRAIDRVSIMTLRDCMQTVFEDGPRRDRRMWLGDLRLQALVNYATLKDFGLVKRCLFMFAAVARDDESLPACLFEKPTLSASSDYLLEYDALFAAIVYDYVAASGDIDSGRVLWSTVLSCLRRPLEYVDPSTKAFDKTRGEDWQFLDWAPGVDTSAGSHGLVLYCLKAAQKLARLLRVGFPHEHMITSMNIAAAEAFLHDGLIVSGPKKQVSYACASWLVLSEALPRSTARAALLKTLSHEEAVKPLTPYAWHHVCDALLVAGCQDECLDIVRSYWGGMIRAGADTFWEAYDPADPLASPYGDVRNNSFCHAWSCTPSLMLRTQLLDKVGGKVTGKMTMGQLDDQWVKQTTRTNSA